MDSRDWMSDPTKKTEEYIRGVNEFLEFAFQNLEADGKIFCPCKKCANTHLHNRTSVYLHLTDPRRGFLRGYRQWVFHGERPTIPINGPFEEPREIEHDMEGLLEDAFAMHPMEEETHDNNETRNPQQGEKTDKFYQLLKENEQILYPNCKKFTKLAFIVQKRGRVHCLGKIPLAKKAKVSSSTDADLREEVMQIKGLLTNVLKIMQNYLPEEAVQNILQLAAEQVSDASSKPNDQNNSESQSS